MRRQLERARFGTGVAAGVQPLYSARALQFPVMSLIVGPPGPAGCRRMFRRGPARRAMRNSLPISNARIRRRLRQLQTPTPKQRLLLPRLTRRAAAHHRQINRIDISGGSSGWVVLIAVQIVRRRRPAIDRGSVRYRPASRRRSTMSAVILEELRSCSASPASCSGRTVFGDTVMISSTAAWSKSTRI